MTISDAEFKEWLADEEVLRAVMVEAEHSAGTKYFGSYPFISTSTDTPASMPFDDLLKSIPQISTSINARTTFGDLVLINDDELDDWLNLKFKGYSLKVKFGDPSWEYDDFRFLIDGINGGIYAPNNDSIGFKVFDKRELFNVPLQTSKIVANPTTLVSHDYPVPISLGEPFNVEPQLVDSTISKYQAHEATCTISSVRDNGVALTGGGVGYTDNGDGTFTLTSAPAGKITNDVTEANTTTKLMVEYICNKISFTDIDNTNLAAFPNTDTQGLYFKDGISTTAAQAMDKVTESVGAFWRLDRLGLLQLSRFEAPGTSIADISYDGIHEFKVRLLRMEDPNDVITLNYERNWSPQDKDGLAGSVSETNRDLYSKEYSKVTKTNSLSGFPMAHEMESINSFIVTKANAQTECDRRALIRNSRRKVYEVTTFVEPFSLNVGDTVTLTFNRYGLESGVDMVIIKMIEKPTENMAVLHLWV
jgi:hypothetical protein